MICSWMRASMLFSNLKRGNTRSSCISTFTHNPKTSKLPLICDFNVIKPAGSHLFHVEHGVLVGANPIAQVHAQKFVWMFYKQFLDYAALYVQERAFQNYRGIKEAADFQLSYMENDLSITHSNLGADKFFQSLGIMQTFLIAFPMEECIHLSFGNIIPDSCKKKIAYNAMHEKYQKS